MSRSKIVNALVTKFKTIDATGVFKSNLFSNVENKLVFWDEVNDFPYVCLNAGQESREYLPGGFKWGYLQVGVRIYVSAEEPEAELEKIFEDIEYILDTNGNLSYDTNKFIEDIKILLINTDEGLLAPIGVGEITLQIMYDLDTST